MNMNASQQVEEGEYQLQALSPYLSFPTKSVKIPSLSTSTAVQKKKLILRNSFPCHWSSCHLVCATEIELHEHTLDIHFMRAEPKSSEPRKPCVCMWQSSTTSPGMLYLKPFHLQFAITFTGPRLASATT
jgi:hypothetical protein